jgi:DNA (cytosine-5)-methyltransferase 1
MSRKLAATYNTEVEALGKRASKFKAKPDLAPKPTPGHITALDLFSGCGGFSSGLLRAAREAGFRVSTVMVNHWSVALDNARENLGDVTVINSGIQEISPREAIPGGYVDIMLASPECVMYSNARGARPIIDQRRSTAGEVLRFLEELWVESLILENVSELKTWGPLDPVTHRPIPERKGEYFAAFIKAIKRLGYDVSYQDVVAADYGDPTTRKRLFLVAQKSRRASLPKPTHSKGGLVPGTLPWVPARQIIDFDVKGLSIFARTTPHVSKTLRRIGIGFSDQRAKTPLAGAYVEAVNRFRRVTDMYYAQLERLPTAKSLRRKLTKSETEQVRTVKTAAQQQHRLLVAEIFRTPVATFTWADILLHEGVQPTVEGDHRLTLGTLSVVDPVVTKLFGTAATTPVDDPLSTIKAGGTTFGLAQPSPDRLPEPETFLVTVNHGDSADATGRHASIDDPLQTITTRGSQGLVEPFCLRANCSDTSGWDDAVTSLADPLRTVTTKANLSLIVPDATILPQHTYAADTTASPDQPLPTITTISRHGLVQPEVTPVDPFIAPNHGPSGPNGDRDRRPHAMDDPLPTQTATSAFALVEGVVIPQQHFNDDAIYDPLDRPLRSIATRNGTGIAQPEAFITPNFGERSTQKPRTHSLDEPLPTATSHGAGMLVAPDVTHPVAAEPVNPIIVNMKGQSTATGVDVPLPTQTAHAPHFYLADPVLVSRHIGFEGKESPNPNLDEPMVTATCRGAGYIAQPEVIPLVDAVLVSQHSGFDNDNPSLDDPIVTATTRGAGYIAQPSLEQDILDRAAAHVTPGKPYIVVDGQIMELDITYRMLHAGELARAMSFDSGNDRYRFRDDASMSERVRMVGNAVAVLTAKAIATHVLAYRFKSGETVDSKTTLVSVA